VPVTAQSHPPPGPCRGHNHGRLPSLAEALRARHRDDDRSAIPAARLEIESLLRDEIADAQREAINENSSARRVSDPAATLPANRKGRSK